MKATARPWFPSVAAAKEKGLRVLVLHLGGKARRGALSDEFNVDTLLETDETLSFLDDADPESAAEIRARTELVLAGRFAHHVHQKTDVFFAVLEGMDVTWEIVLVDDASGEAIEPMKGEVRK